MRYTKKIKLVAVSVIASTLLVGCGSDDNSGAGANMSAKTTISGVASDPELQGANVYLDANANATYDNGELNTTTDVNGNYTLEIPEADLGKAIIVEGGVDKVTKEPFEGQLSVISTKDIENHITPLTTLVQKYQIENPQESIEDIKTTLSDKLGIDADDLYKDTTKDGNEKLLSIALQLEKVAQSIEENDATITKSSEVYNKMVTELDKLQTNEKIKDAIDNLVDNSTSLDQLSKAKVKDLNDELSNVVSLVDTSSFTKEGLALSIEKIDTEIAGAGSADELLTNLYENDDMMVSTSEVADAQRDAIYKALGLDKLSADDLDSLNQKFKDIEFDLTDENPLSTYNKIKEDNFFNDNESTLKSSVEAELSYSLTI